MQLRKVVNHPFLFYWPKDSYGNELLDEELMNASGKLLLLSQILDRLLAEGHKVLIFSNFARMLDIVHDWLNIVKKLEVYRIDGTTKEHERGPQVTDFNNPDSGESSVHLRGGSAVLMRRGRRQGVPLDDSSGRDGYQPHGCRHCHLPRQ